MHGMVFMLLGSLNQTMETEKRSEGIMGTVRATDQEKDIKL